MGFVPDYTHHPPSPEPVTKEIGRRENVAGLSVTRIKLDAEGVAVYSHEVPVEFGFWARVLPPDVIAPEWSHHWMRLECRYDPPQRREKRRNPPTDARLEELHGKLAEIRVGPTEALAWALLELGEMQQALGRLSDALATYTEAWELLERTSSNAATANREPSREVRLLRASALAGRAEMLYALSRIERPDTAGGDGEDDGPHPSLGLEEALGHLERARELLVPLANEDPKQYGVDLIRCLDQLARVYEALGHHARTVELHAEIVERGSLGPGDTLIMAETPLGRRRYDRGVFRRGLNGKKPYFGKKLCKAVASRWAAALAKAKSSQGPFPAVDASLVVLEALEDPKIVTRDPFTTNDDVLIAGISVPSAPFLEPERDYTPPWNDEDARRTGWVIGVCTDAKAVHARVLATLEPLVAKAQEGKLLLFPPSFIPDAQPRRPSAEEIGKAAEELAPAAAWMAMAGTKNPVGHGGRVDRVALCFFHDLLYDHLRRVRRSTGKQPPPPDCSGEMPNIGGGRKTLADQLLVIEAKLAIPLEQGEEWARQAKALIGRCNDEHAQKQDLMELGADLALFQRHYGGRLVPDEVLDYVEQWITETVLGSRGRSSSGCALPSQRKRRERLDAS